MCSFAEYVQNVTHTVALGINQVIAFTRNFVMVADVIQCINHKINRNNVDTPTFQTNCWHPRREKLAHALNQFEKVIRPVNFVHLTRLAITNNHGGTVNTPGNFAFLANDFFTFMLGSKIRVIIIFSLFKHVFAKNTFIKTSSCY